MNSRTVIDTLVAYRLSEKTSLLNKSKIDTLLAHLASFQESPASKVKAIKDLKFGLSADSITIEGLNNFDTYSEPITNEFSNDPSSSSYASQKQQEIKNLDDQLEKQQEVGDYTYVVGNVRKQYQNVQEHIKKINDAIANKNYDTFIEQLNFFQETLTDIYRLLDPKNLKIRVQLITDAFKDRIEIPPLSNEMFVRYYEKTITEPESTVTLSIFRNLIKAPTNSLEPLRFLTHDCPLDKALSVAKSFIPENKEKEFKQELYGYIMLHYQDILEAQIKLNTEKKKAPEKIETEFPTFLLRPITAEWEAKVAQTTLLLMKDLLLTVNWDTGSLKGVKYYDEKKEYKNTVYKEMMAMLLAINDAQAKDPTGTDEIWISTLTNIMKDGYTASQKKSTSLFGAPKYSPIAQSFFNSAIAIHKRQENLAEQKKADEKQKAEARKTQIDTEKKLEGEKKAKQQLFKPSNVSHKEIVKSEGNSNPEKRLSR